MIDRPGQLWCLAVCGILFVPAAMAAAQVNWQVMIPSEESDANAASKIPLSQWGREGQFNTLQECLAYREQLFREADMIEMAVGRKVPKWEIVRAAQCISTGDPRLKDR